MPELPLPDTFDSITYAVITDDEKRETHAPLGIISIAAVTGDFSRPSAQRRNRSASAAYTALPCYSRHVSQGLDTLFNLTLSYEEWCVFLPSETFKF